MFPAGVFPSDYYHLKCQIIKGCLLQIELETIYQSRWSVPKALYFYVRAFSCLSAQPFLTIILPIRSDALLLLAYY
jgi:hypothetical protein